MTQSSGPDDVAGEIGFAKWNQGDVLPETLASRVRDYCQRDSDCASLRSIHENGVYVLLSHVCDLQRPPDKEPFVEAIFGEIREGQPEEQKTIRFADLPLNVGGVDKFARFEDRNRIRFPRQWLESYHPHSGVRISRNDARRLVRMVVKRFDRPAFPTAFEDALRPAKKKISRIVKPLGSSIRMLGFNFVPESELEAGQRYELTIMALVREDVWNKNELLERVEEALIRVAEIIEEKCPSINMRDAKSNDLRCSVESDAVLSVKRSEEMKRYDFDYLSPDEDDLPPELPD